ncbi:MAG: 4-alpha-glucanotransferase, partial [Myxococcota bacterium]|nr:4-alpha-glucanotransferase [Myxococcota bacterium]
SGERVNSRRAGVLLHPTSLPGPEPCGTLGPQALDWLDWLGSTGCTLWQILPLNPTAPNLSPYDSPGGLALDPHLLSIESVIADGLLDPGQLAGAPPSTARVDPRALNAWHRPRAIQAARSLVHDDPDALTRFRQDQPWLDPWSLYQTLTHIHGRNWRRWPVDLARGVPDALDATHREFAEEIAIEQAIQLLVHRQWTRVLSRARTRGITVLGDLPIYVGRDSADTWSRPELFQRNQGGEFDPVSGVPPDLFSEDGQFWGSPVPDWNAHALDDFRWWRERIRLALARHDAVRLDHFRGFCAYWAVDLARAPSARIGRWLPGPGRALFEALREDRESLPLVVEDLGHLTPDVPLLRSQLGLPGMKVLQFAFGGDEDHPFLPHTWTRDDWVVYPGTHDNSTARGWFESAPPEVREHFVRYVANQETSNCSLDPEAEPHWALIELALASRARWAVLPMQDLLGLGDEARFNTPGTPTENWEWRLRDMPCGLDRLGERIQAHARQP